MAAGSSCTSNPGRATFSRSRIRTCNWTNWKQCSYNGSIRKNYPGPGFTYDEARDAFIAPQPFPSWVLDEATCRWNAPVPYPTDGKMYRWDEETTNWIEVTV